MLNKLIQFFILLTEVLIRYFVLLVNNYYNVYGKLYMNWLDIAILIIITASSIRSFFKGFTNEIFSIIALLGALIISYNFFIPLATLLENLIKEPLLTKIISFVLLFVIVYYLLHYVGDSVASLWKRLHLGFFDRLLGGALGFIKGGLVVIIILIVFQLSTKLVPINSINESMQNSKIADYCIQNWFPKVIPFIESAFQNVKNDMPRINQN